MMSMKRSFEQANSNIPQKKQRLSAQPANFRGAGSQAKAFDYVKTHGGVVIGRDDGRAKQFYVCTDWDHVYDFVFSQDKEQQNFYELIRENTPAKLVIDLDLKPEQLQSAEVLEETMDTIQAKTIRVTLAKLSQAGVQVAERNIQVYHSDGT